MRPAILSLGFLSEITYLKSPGKLLLTKRTSVNKGGSHALGASRGSRSDAAWSWPSRVMGKGSMIETHSRLESNWSVRGQCSIHPTVHKDVSQHSLTMNLRHTHI